MSNKIKSNKILISWMVLKYLCIPLLRQQTTKEAKSVLTTEEVFAVKTKIN